MWAHQKSNQGQYATTQTQQQQWDFLVDVFLSNSLSGALGHSGTYIKTRNKDEDKWLNKGKEKLYEVLKAARCELTAKYSTGASVATEEHMESLQRLKQCAKDNCAEFLRGGELRLGVAARLLKRLCQGQTSPVQCVSTAFFAREVEDQGSGKSHANHVPVEDRSTNHRYGLDIDHDSSMRTSRRRRRAGAKVENIFSFSVHEISHPHEQQKARHAEARPKIV